MTAHESKELAGDFGDAPHSDLDFQTWTALSHQNFPHIELSTPNESTFRAGQRFVALDEIQLFDMHTSPHTVEQRDVLTHTPQPQLCKLSLQFSGTTSLVQDGRACELQPGDLALYVAHRPYTLQFLEDQRSLIIQFPQELLHLTHNQVIDVTAIPISSDVGLGKVAVPLFEQLAANLHVLEGPHALRLVRSALDMLVTVLHEASRNTPNASNDNPLFRQAVAYIADHLSDPNLGPHMIADYFYVSVRQLHGKFSEEGETVGSYIRTERLRRIRDELADPTLQHETVQTISARYGLIDASHMSKVFKQAYGQSPSAYRRSIFGD